MIRFTRAFFVVSLAIACKDGTSDPATKPPAFSSPVAAPSDGSGSHSRSERPVDATDRPGDKGRAASERGRRVPMVDRGHSDYGRLEGTAYDNECEDDAGCHASGCGGEVCSADKDAVSTCEVLPLEWPPESACGCVDGICQWWNPRGIPLPNRPGNKQRVEAKPPQEGPKCGNERCKPGEECITYRGIAGAKGPVFRECGIRCRRGQPRGGCPEGMRCVMIADGPGPVCR
jgi:eight-cysteine-cluster-containing protein